MCMYVSGFCDIISVSHPLYSLLDRWNILHYTIALLLSHLFIWEQYQYATELWKCCRLLQYILAKHSDTCYHSTFLFYDTTSLHSPITLTPNRDSVKPEPQLCMNQNNNPQRFLLPPFPDIPCDSFSVERSTRENPLRLISSPDTPTCRGVTAGCPSSAFQSLWLCVCVCVPLKQDVLEDFRGQWGWVSISESPEWCYDITNFLIGCVAL